MPHELNLSRRLKVQGWKIKIREKERLERPHVTVMFKTREWRLNLRNGDFLVPPGGSWNEIDADVRAIIEANWRSLQMARDAKYPTNPIANEAVDDRDDWSSEALCLPRFGGALVPTLSRRACVALPNGSRDRKRVRPRLRRSHLGLAHVGLDRSAREDGRSTPCRDTTPGRSRYEAVFIVGAPRPGCLATLHGLFPHIFGDSPGYRWLPKEELLEALLSKDVDRSELILAATADIETETVTLVRGNCEVVVVPFTEFEPAGDGTLPDFTELRLTDYGRTLRFGDYKAPADAILYGADPKYRQRKASERTFGASLCRLRKQRKLTRDDFAPLTPKTIARIERGEVGKPHADTVRTIARRFGVAPNDIANF